MRIQLTFAIVAAGFLAGCGGGGVDDDAGPDIDAAAACDDDCVPGWWTVVTGGCSALCSLSPAPRECAEADCEQLEANEFREDTAHSLLWMTHSPSNRTFSLVGIFPEDTWSLPMACELAIEDAQSSPFTCTSNDEIQFTTRTYRRASPELEAALVSARAQGQGEYSY